MKILNGPTLACLALAGLTLIGCRSKTGSEAQAAPAAESGPTCICGTAEAAIEACIHPACMDGESNAGNPDCACGSLSIEE